MSRYWVFTLFFLAVFLQAGAYGLTFMLPLLFEQFGANEKIVGTMLAVTAVTTLVTVYFSGHLADWLGRVATLGLACLSIAGALILYGIAQSVGPGLFVASILLGTGWALTYSLAPVVLTRLVVAAERVRYFALLSIFVMAGFGLSPVLAATLESAGLSVAIAFHVMAVLCLISAVLFFVLISAIRHHSDGAGVESKSSLSLTAVVGIVRSPALLPVVMVCLGASVFAGMNNFQTVFAEERGLNYATYFLTYTITVVLFRIVLVRFTGGNAPYRTIALLQYVMAASIVLFIYIAGDKTLYFSVAVLFGIGYGVSYPILVAMAANDAEEGLVPQTLQLFALTYFVGIFGFPLIAGWMIVELGTPTLLWLVFGLAVVEASLALRRALRRPVKEAVQ